MGRPALPKIATLLALYAVVFGTLGVVSSRFALRAVLSGFPWLVVPIPYALTIVSTAAWLGLSVMLLVGGVGMLARQRWGWLTLLVQARLTLLHQLVLVVVWSAHLRSWESGHTLLLFVGLHVLGVLIPAGFLVGLTRPTVIRACAPG